MKKFTAITLAAALAAALPLGAAVAAGDAPEAEETMEEEAEELLDDAEAAFEEEETAEDEDFEESEEEEADEADYESLSGSMNLGRIYFNAPTDWEYVIEDETMTCDLFTEDGTVLTEIALQEVDDETLETLQEYGESAGEMILDEIIAGLEAQYDFEKELSLPAYTMNDFEVSRVYAQVSDEDGAYTVQIVVLSQENTIVLAIYMADADQPSFYEREFEGILTSMQYAVEKMIEVSVVDDQGETSDFEITTYGTTLLDAINECDEIEVDGYDAGWGYYVTTVNGVEADYDADGAYWSVYVNGDYGMYSVDTQPIEDGDSFVLAYEVYEMTDFEGDAEETEAAAE